jgi:hypothetical protein
MTEDKTPDYINYTLEELFQSYYNVDKERYPENYQAIVNELRKRKADIPQEEISGIDEVPQKISLPEEISLNPPKNLPIFQIIKNAIKIVNKNLIFIPFIALSMLLIMPNVLFYISLLLLVISSFLYIIVFGRLVETVMNLHRSSWLHLLKVHCINYLIAIFLIAGIPSLIFSFLISETTFQISKTVSFPQVQIIKNLFLALVACLTIYVIPFVFIRRQIFSSISYGIKILFNSLWISIPLIFLTLCTYLTQISKWLIYIIIPPQIDIYTILGINFILISINVYIILIVFSAATFILKETGVSYVT